MGVGEGVGSCGAVVVCCGVSFAAFGAELGEFEDYGGCLLRHPNESCRAVSRILGPAPM